MPDRLRKPISIAEKKRLIQALHEKYWIEMKKANELPKSFWESYSAFANTKGGYIILGVAEKTPENEIIGVGNTNKTLADMWNQLSNRNKVSFSAISNEDVFTITINGADVIVIHVNEAPDAQKPVYLNNNPDNAYLRTGDGDRRADISEIAAMRRNASASMDGISAEHFTMADLDKDSVLVFKELVSIRYPAKGYLEMTNEEFLLEIGACGKDRISGEIKIKRGAVLFLGKVNSIHDLYPHYHVDYFNHKGDNPRWSDRVSDDEPGMREMNLFNFYRIIAEKLHTVTESAFRFVDRNTRAPEPEFDEMMRECLVNCLAHCDYEQGIPSVRIDVYDKFITFVNPGKMLVPERQFRNGGESRIRNEIIMKLFRLIGASERQGFGGPLIYKTATDNEFRAPAITTFIEKTELKVWNTGVIDSFDDLTEQDKLVIRLIYTDQEGSSIRNMCEHLDLTEYNLSKKILPRLIEKKIIKKEGRSRSTRYMLNDETADDHERIAYIINMLSQK